MTTSVRTVVEGPQEHGADESIRYAVNVTGWAATPSNISIKIYDVNAGYVDVTSATTRDSYSVSGSIITTPYIESLTIGKVYRVEILFTTAADTTSTTLELYFFLNCTR